MLYSNNDVTHNYNVKDNIKSNWCTADFHCGLCGYIFFCINIVSSCKFEFILVLLLIIDIIPVLNFTVFSGFT